LGEAGDEVEVPTGLYRMGTAEDRTDAEVEANHVTANDSEVTGD
jgi:hypothetical protein